MEKELQKLHQKHNPAPATLQPIKTIEPIRRISRFSVVTVAEKLQQVKNTPLQLNLNSPSTSVYNPQLVFGKSDERGEDGGEGWKFNLIFFLFRY